MSDELAQTVMIPIWSADTGYTGFAAAKLIAAKCGCSEEDACGLFKITQNAIKRLQKNEETKDLFPIDEKNPHPLSDIYFGYPDNRRMGQAFIDAITGKSRIFLEPTNLLKDFQKTSNLTEKDKEDVLCYLIAHELEHACQGQRAPILEIINKQNPLDNRSKSPEFEAPLLDTLIESDAIALGLVSAQKCGISKNALNHLQTNYFTWLPDLRNDLLKDASASSKERNLIQKIKKIRESYWPNKEFNYPNSLIKATKFSDIFNPKPFQQKADRNIRG